MSAALCPRFHKAVELIGGRWTGPILQLLMNGRARYAELRDAIPHISDRMLSERLRELEAEGLVARTVIPAPPIRVEYALTDKGRELQAPLRAIGTWAERWMTLEGSPPSARKAAPVKRRRKTPPAARSR